MSQVNSKKYGAVELVKTVSGWSTIRLADGTEKKVRGADIGATPAKKARKKVPAKKAAAAKKTPANGERKNGMVDPAYLDQYVRVKGPDGRVHRDKDDAVAVRLRGLTIDDMYREVSGIKGVPMTELRAKYADFNNGQVRMNLGNAIRAAANKKAAARAERATASKGKKVARRASKHPQ